MNRLGLEITGGTAGVVGRLLGRTLLKAITTENEGFKKVAEAKVAETAG